MSLEAPPTNCPWCKSRLEKVTTQIKKRTFVSYDCPVHKTIAANL